MSTLSKTIAGTDPILETPLEASAQAAVATPGRGGVRIARAVTICKPAEDLYAFWRDVENLPVIIRDPVSITALSRRESHWAVSAPPGDRQVEWDAVIVEDKPGRVIGWQSLEGAEVPNSGTVRFEPAPGDEGTEVSVLLEYSPPGGKIGAWLSKLSGEEAGQQVDHALRRFKALMEAGEIPTTEGQPKGKA